MLILCTIVQSSGDWAVCPASAVNPSTISYSHYLTLTPGGRIVYHLLLISPVSGLCGYLSNRRGDTFDFSGASSSSSSSSLIIIALLLLLLLLIDILLARISIIPSVHYTYTINLFLYHLLLISRRLLLREFEKEYMS